MMRVTRSASRGLGSTRRGDAITLKHKGPLMRAFVFSGIRNVVWRL